jgi:membrane-bound lytic murein transglycosylase MltF
LRSRLRHYSRLAAMAPKLARVVRDFAWEPMAAVAAREAARLDAQAQVAA